MSVIDAQDNSDNIKYFYAFFGAWAPFNALYSEDSQIHDFRSKMSERDRVVSFAHRDAFGDLHLKLIENGEYREQVEFFVNRRPDEPPWLGSNCKGLKANVWNLDETHKDKVKKQGICKDMKDLEGLLGCIYVVRCNLFHGSKAVGYEDDVRVVRAGFVILSSLLKCLANS
jgi:hypothetical protein